MITGRTKKAEIAGVDLATLKAMLKYMYTGNFETDKVDITKLVIFINSLITSESPEMVN